MAARVDADTARLGAALALWRSGDRDGALDAGLMAVDPVGTALTAEDVIDVLAVQAGLRSAWQARERHRQRAMRLARRDAERRQRRAIPVDPRSGTPPTLPPAAAAALARAKARAGLPE